MVYQNCSIVCSALFFNCIGILNIHLKRGQLSRQLLMMKSIEISLS